MYPSNEQLERINSYINEHMPFDNNDDSLIVLKAHLICEELINDYITHFTPYPKYILGKNVRSYMHEKIKFARAISSENVHDKFIWEGLKNLNNLRNAYAHSLVPDNKQLKKSTKKFIKHIKQNAYNGFEKLNLSEFRCAIKSLLIAIFSVFEIAKNNSK